MRISIFLCISLAVCTFPVKSENATIATSTTTTATSTTTETTTTTTSASTLAHQNASSNETSTNKKYNYDDLKEATKRGLMLFTLEFQKYAFKATGTDGKNIIFSPANVAGILATLLLGAEGNTKSEILHAIGIVDQDLSDKDHIHLALGSLFENFTSETHDNPATILEISQSVFLQNGTLIKDFFRNFSQTIYKNEIIDIDFSNANTEAADIINNWIANRTHNRIEKLVDPPIQKNTKMILANCLFFNGEWESPFSNATSWKPFYTETGNYSVKMMMNIGSAYVLRNRTCKYSALGLPYKGGNITMYFILPNRGEKLENVLSSLTTDDMLDVVSKAEKYDELSYDVPYMNINDEIQLNKILENIGVKSIFDPAQANLSNIANDIFVSQIIHKANLDVTEAGSTGSAISAAQIETKFPAEPFIIDRPFICFVYHRSSGLISFWGTINLPVPNKPL